MPLTIENPMKHEGLKAKLLLSFCMSNGLFPVAGPLVTLGYFASLSKEIVAHRSAEPPHLERR